jgi:hypothetical protein
LHSLELLQSYFEHGGQIEEGALHAAVLRTDDNRFQRVELLLQQGADINFIKRPTFSGSALAFARRRSTHFGTPLYDVVAEKRVDMAAFLLGRGADPFIQTKLGGFSSQGVVPADLMKDAAFDSLREERLLLGEEQYSYHVFLH